MTDEIERMFPGYPRQPDGSYGKRLAQLRSAESKQARRGEGEDRSVDQGAKGASFCVVLTVFRRRLLDSHDNERMACKPLADHITRMLGLNDDRLVAWSYHQIQSPIEGTHVLITR